MFTVNDKNPLAWVVEDDIGSFISASQYASWYPCVHRIVLAVYVAGNTTAKRNHHFFLFMLASGKARNMPVVPFVWFYMQQTTARQPATLPTLRLPMAGIPPTLAECLAS